VHSIPINPSDILFLEGNYKMPISFPFVPGWECSGEVVEAGPEKLA
jgi:NADPH:quinone reductase-like Zn-dependent oxidoreductase